jgi:hypothetical protein
MRNAKWYLSKEMRKYKYKKRKLSTGNNKVGFFQFSFFESFDSVVSLTFVVCSSNTFVVFATIEPMHENKVGIIMMFQLKLARACD